MCALITQSTVLKLFDQQKIIQQYTFELNYLSLNEAKIPQKIPGSGPQMSFSFDILPSVIDKIMVK